MAEPVTGAETRGGPSRLVFLTGGTGLIGSHVAERLRARGDEVLALVRPDSDTRHLARIGCRLVTGDLLDPVQEIAARMRGADAVVHSGAKVYQSGSRAAFTRVNAEGTERMIEAARLVSPRFLHVSSVAVYAGLIADRLTEERWVDADPDRQARYAASKHLAERAAWRAHERGEIRLTTVRPSVVYGERDRSAWPVLVRVASRPFLLIPGGGRTTVPVVYAGNVARAIVSALDRDASIGRAYNLGQDVPITGRELAEALMEGLGRTPRILSLPAAPIRALGAGLDRVLARIPGLDPGPGRKARALTQENPYDCSRARLELGWTGLTPHAVGIRRTLDWWMERD